MGTRSVWWNVDCIAGIMMTFSGKLNPVPIEARPASVNTGCDHASNSIETQVASYGR